ncbi:MAG TPA: ImmA/IrrE family metallo-endopeptidase [Oligoflexus sp.]|uniref:ImmA/IrrE family metallo-endopeptidase n=1 Tax=Oligoflexus sp. TaxID=1971216 RepID=UPI002D60FCE0|nr:ImmA/IrrE family metallo-endopeptidase [Oligoflexus sp.]HYX33035.1 ImmA/IrrE family metallo-endopeptidase [Oligoflexus sp.]
MLALFPEILHMVNSGDLETLACLVRKYFADKQIYSPRLRVEPLLINAGLELSRDDIGDAARLFAADHRGAWHASLILSPSLRDPGEVNFTLAHLFGHFLCEIQPLMAKGELKTHEVRERSGALGRFLKKPSGTPEELQADAFANALLMPRGMVKKAYATLGTARDTAAFFNVRPELMEQRLAQLELVATQTEAAQTPAAEPAAKPAPKPTPKPQQSSLEKAQKSVAASHYRREEESAAKPATPKSSEGLSRLRAIARKIDKSVDP